MLSLPGHIAGRKQAPLTRPGLPHPLRAPALPQAGHTHHSRTHAHRFDLATASLFALGQFFHAKIEPNRLRISFQYVRPFRDDVLSPA